MKSLAQEVLQSFNKEEGREDIYKILSKMDNASWNSFIADIQSEYEKQTGKIIPTHGLGKAMSTVVGRT